MCPSTNTFKHYVYCSTYGHTLPLGACNKYAPGLRMCLEDPVSPKKFNFKTMEHGGVVRDVCSFCKEGKDLDGAYLYGEYWQERQKHRK